MGRKIVGFLLFYIISRPNNVNELTHQDEACAAMKGIIKTGNMPHLLFHGPAGTGKTSLILAFAKELYGPKFY